MTNLQESERAVRFWRLLAFPLAAIFYTAMLGWMTWSAGVPGFWSELFSWSAAKYFHAYSLLYFAGVVLLIPCLHVRSDTAFSDFRIFAGFWALAMIAFGGFAVVTVLSSYAEKMQV